MKLVIVVIASLLGGCAMFRSQCDDLIPEEAHYCRLRQQEAFRTGMQYQQPVYQQYPQRQVHIETAPGVIQTFNR